MKILRVYTKSREILEIEPEIKKISLNKVLEQKLKEENVETITKDETNEYIDKIIDDCDIIISTCSNSWDEGISKYYFPFIIIDQVTQCCEMESLVSIIHGCRHLTLIGDQKQLGPVIIHPKAKKYGMNISIFEMMLKLYPD